MDEGPDTETPATADELAELRRLHDDETFDPWGTYPIRGGLSAYGVIELLLRTIADMTKHEPVVDTDSIGDAILSCACGWDNSRDDRSYFDHIGAK